MANEYDISKSFKRIENDLMDSMMRNLKRHQAEETKEGFNWAQWQALQLKELERYRKENIKKFGGDFSQINNRIEDLFKQTSADAQAKEEARILDDIRKGKYYANKKDVSFFNVNDQKLDVLIERTKADFSRAEYAVLRGANDQYRQIIFDAQVYGNITNDYAKAVDMATHDYLQKGLQSIVYKNGARHTISDYAEMAIRTGNKRAYLMGEGNAHDAYGIHTIRVNKRTQACPKCVGFLGKVMVDDVYAGGTPKEASKLGVPLLSQAIQQGFLHPNCKDIYSMYIPNVSKPADPWTKQEIEDIVGDYNAEQELQHALDMQESYARMAKYSLDKDNKAKYQARADGWADRVTDIKNGIRYPITAPEAEVKPLPEIKHDGIRELIESDGGTTTRGIIKLGASDIQLDQSQTLGGIPYTTVTIPKKITIPWDQLSQDAQDYIGWYIPARYKKNFYIQPNDITWMSHPKVEQLSNRSLAKIQSALDNGFELYGQTYFSKYNHSVETFLLKKDGELYLSLMGTENTVAISDDMLKAIKSREKVVSKQLWDEGVHFRELTERQGDGWVNAMQKFHTATEADKPVTLVSRAEYDKIKGEELYRGIAPVSHLRGDISMTKTPMQCAEQLMTGGVGDCFPSRGVYGDVVAYLSNSTSTAFDYATGYRRSGAGGVITRMKIHPDARVISYTDAKNLFNAIADKLGDTKEPYFSRAQRRLTNNVEVGKAMQMLGYDVIYEPRGDGMNVHFYMVLNREAIVAVKDDWVKAEITEAVYRRGHI